MLFNEKTLINLKKIKEGVKGGLDWRQFSRLTVCFQKSCFVEKKCKSLCNSERHFY